MAVIHRNRKVAYDNIAAGSATGRERTISGELPSTEVYGGGVDSGANRKGFSNIAAGQTASDVRGDQYPSNSSYSGVNRATQGGSTDQNTTPMMTSENVG